LTGEEIVEETKKHAVKAWGKILPFGAQVIASAAAYSVGLTATQVSLQWCSMHTMLCFSVLGLLMPPCRVTSSSCKTFSFDMWGN
jgi:hypothetical protein